MKRHIMLFSILSLLLMQHPCVASNGPCQVFLGAEENSLLSKSWEPLGQAKIFSNPVIVPSFKLRFIDNKTKKDIASSKISIAYGWKWLEYPYPEHSWGVWSTDSDRVDCIEPGTEILVPEYEVRPRGWYDGKYVKFPFTITGSKRPSFTGINISMYDVGCNRNTWVELSPKEVSKLKKNNSVTIEINCAGHSTVIIK